MFQGVLKDVVDSVRPGMSVRASVTVGVDSQYVLLPMWLMTDLRYPEVVRADGGRIPVKGYLLNSSFVVTEGVANGDLLRVPTLGGGGENRIRVSGKLEAVDPLVLEWLIEVKRSWHHDSSYIYDEIVADGSMVEKGDVVARALHRFGGENEEVFQLESEKLEEEAGLSMARIEAESGLIAAYVTWQRGRMQAEKARLRYLVARYGSYELQQTRADVALSNARLGLEAARHEARDAISDDTGFLSEHSKRDAVLAQDLSEVSYRKAELTAVAALRVRDWLGVQNGERAMAELLDAARAKRQAYRTACSKYRLDLHRAARKFRSFMDRYESKKKRMESLELVAPRAGRVFYAAGLGGAPRLGAKIERREAMIMPVGRQWQFDVRIPSRLYGEFKEGDEINFALPALGQELVRGRVFSVASYFEPGTSASSDEQLRGSLGGSAPVFRVRMSPS